MSEKINIAGIYDLRTLKLLKTRGLKSFGFDFAPTSFNFLPAHIFLKDLLPVLEKDDEIFLHFTRSDDSMIEKLISDIKNLNFSESQILISCDHWVDSPWKKGVRCLLSYEQSSEFLKDLPVENESLFAGLSFDFDYLNELHIKGVLDSFLVNFYSLNQRFLKSQKMLALNLKWEANIFPSLFDRMDFDRISLRVDSKVESCYRNVDLKKLSFELDYLKNSYQI